MKYQNFKNNQKLYRGIFIKIFYFLLLLIPSVFADLQSFPNTIIVHTFNGTLNITTEQNDHVYDCMSNTTSTFIFTLQRNLSTSTDLTNTLNNFTGNVNNLLATCDSITKQYGDINTYFKLYTTCNTDLTICNKDKDSQKNQITELTPFKSNYEGCSKNLNEITNKNNELTQITIPKIQSNLSSMNINLNQADKSKWLYFFFGLISMGIVLIIREKKKSPMLQRHKTLGLQGGTQR